jgi:NADP-dependent 3-hydroxy acid dehydrogenase YdfG
MKIIVITGATTGIGWDPAIRLARAGHQVFATGRDLVALAALRAEAPLCALFVDVTKRDTIEAAVQEVEEATGDRGIDVLIMRAG